LLAREFYTMLCEDLLESRRAVRCPEVDLAGLVWPRLSTTVLGVEARFTMLTVVNQVFRNCEFMFHISCRAVAGWRRPGSGSKDTCSARSCHLTL
jgi:hypothetical protein